jgi:hypothetical protein
VSLQLRAGEPACVEGMEPACVEGADLPGPEGGRDREVPAAESKIVTFSQVKDLWIS